MSNLSKVMLCVGVLSLIVLSGCYLYEGEKWDTTAMPLITYKVDPNIFSNDEIAAIQKGAKAWNDVGTTFQLADGGANSYHRGYLDADYINTITKANLGEDFNSFIAISRVWVTGGTLIDEAEIVFNISKSFSALAADSCPSGAYDVQSVAAHEFGHWLRLADIKWNFAKMNDLTMFIETSMGDTKKRSLEFSDMDGIKHIY